MCVSTYIQISWAKGGSLTGSNCLSTTSDQLLVKRKLFLGAAPRSQTLIITTEQRRKWLYTIRETDYVELV